MKHLTPALLAATAAATPALGAKLAGVQVVDDRTLAVHVLDGEVERIEGPDEGEHAFGGHESRSTDKLVRYDPPLKTDALDATNFSLVVPGDDADTILQPSAVHRRAKVNGVPMDWPEPPHTLAHVVFLRFDEPMTAGQTYTLEIDAATGIDTRTAEVTFDPIRSETPALHVNIVGYDPVAPVKTADLYAWLGDGGAADYSDAVGRAVTLVDQDTGETFEAGEVKHWKDRGEDWFGRDVTASPVWSADFGPFDRPGTYRLSVDGIGASKPFAIEEDVYRTPLEISVLGLYYMRIGEPMSEGNTSVMSDDLPPPRQPRFIDADNAAGLPGDEGGFKVIRTTMSPDHPEWATLGGDPWDRKDWSPYVEEGSPTNPDAWGAHSDALDWDRRFQHISIVFDTLLPYVLHPEHLGDDDFRIRESGNGVPDLIDSAAYEADFWRRLRDADGGYSYGVNNPMEDHTVAYQAASAPVMAHANAAMHAMMADAYRLAGDDAGMQDYLASAIEAYEIGGDEELDKRIHVASNGTYGRDLKATAAAYLYKVTGEKQYEDDFAELCRITTGDEPVIQSGDTGYNFVWAAAGYLTCADDQTRPINHPDLVDALRRAVVNEATQQHVANAARFPSRRGSDDRWGWFPGVTEVNTLMLAHHSGDATDEQKDEMLAAMLTEADFSLGRNPLNLALMTGKPLVGEHFLESAYTTGRNDGFPGVHPGHTPYFGDQDWGSNFMSAASWHYEKGYPKWESWPYGEGAWPGNPYLYCVMEFTPQQTVAPKLGLYAYLRAALAERR